MTNNFSKLFTLAIAGLALTMSGQVRAEDPSVEADTLETADNVEDSLFVQASIGQRLALDIRNVNLAAAPLGVTRTDSQDGVDFSHADSAQKALPQTEIGKLHLISNYNAGYKVYGCSDSGSRLNHESISVDPTNDDAKTKVDYMFEITGGGGGLVPSEEMSLEGCTDGAAGEANDLLVDGGGLQYENSVVALDEAGQEVLADPYTMMISWNEDVTRVSGSYEDTIRLKIFGL